MSGRDRLVRLCEKCRQDHCSRCFQPWSGEPISELPAGSPLVCTDCIRRVHVEESHHECRCGSRKCDSRRVLISRGGAHDGSHYDTEYSCARCYAPWDPDKLITTLELQCSSCRSPIELAPQARCVECARDLQLVRQNFGAIRCGHCDHELVRSDIPKIFRCLRCNNLTSVGTVAVESRRVPSLKSDPPMELGYHVPQATRSGTLASAIKNWWRRLFG